MILPGSVTLLRVLFVITVRLPLLIERAEVFSNIKLPSNNSVSTGASKVTLEPFLTCNELVYLLPSYIAVIGWNLEDLILRVNPACLGTGILIVFAVIGIL